MLFGLLHLAVDMHLFLRRASLARQPLLRVQAIGNAFGRLLLSRGPRIFKRSKLGGALNEPLGWDLNLIKTVRPVILVRRIYLLKCLNWPLFIGTGKRSSTLFAGGLRAHAAIRTHPLTLGLNAGEQTHIFLHKLLTTRLPLRERHAVEALLLDVFSSHGA